MTSENIPNPSIRDMIRQLSGSNVTAATNMYTPTNPAATNMYTPTNPFKVNYCGLKDYLPDYLPNDPEIVNSVIVKFDREEVKTVTIRKMIPEIELREDNSLGFYRRKGRVYKKIKILDSELKEMSKRRNRQELVLYLYVQEDNPEVYHPQPPDNSTHVTHDEVDAGATENQSNGDDQIQIQPVYEDGRNGPLDYLNQSQDIDFHSSSSRSPARSDYPGFEFRRTWSPGYLRASPGLATSPSPGRGPAWGTSPGAAHSHHTLPRSPGRSATLSRISISRTALGVLRPASDNLELPDPADCFTWKKITDIPVGQELNLEDVAEIDLPGISKFVQEVKVKQTMFEEMDVNTTTTPSEMSSECSLSELLEKGKLLSQEFADFKSDRKLSSSLVTFLCLITASDAVEETHVVTPDEVKNIQNNVAPIKPAQNVKNIIILNTDNDLPLIALVKIDNGEYYLNNILTINNSKHYVSKLLIRDVCNNLSIDVNYSQTVCENLKEFSSEDGEKLPLLSLFYSARNMLGLNPPSSLKELERLIEMAHIRVKELKQTSEVDSEIDWFSIYENSRKRNREAD